MQRLTQTQKIEQTQQLSAQQVLVAKLTELSVEELRARIETECEENPYLERTYDNENDDENENGDYNDNENDNENENYKDDGLSSSNSEDDDWDSNEFPTAWSDPDKKMREDGETLSFHELLMQQMGEYDLDEHQEKLLEYLIGSLDDDGLLRTPIPQIADELYIYHGIDATEKELLQVLSILQEFEPAGVGATNLIECLLIQARRNKTLSMRNQIITMLERYATEFVQHHWDVIQRKMKLSEAELAATRRSLQKLNPRPGGSIGKAAEDGANIVIPDFRVEADEYGELHFSICEKGIPQLQMSEDPSEWMSLYDNQDESTMRREVKEALRYQRNMIQNGNMFIEALAQRRRSMTAVMRTILKLQKDFFLEGDQTMLKPMKLEDIAERTDLDISTVSRVCRSKSVSTEFGTFSLRKLFTSGTTKDGESLSVNHILSALKKLIDSEDKRHPYSDEYLTDALKKQGYDVARRTVAKYREQLGIPNSRGRR